MKVVFYALTSIVLFLFVFTFMAQNSHDIQVQYYFGMVWNGPVAILLLLTLGMGILFGVFTSSLILLRLKIRLVRTARKLRALQSNAPAAQEKLTRMSS
ncbi:MAG TPA: hypothetical protein DCF72_11805 [Gammaproteobacteria bacterium]|nr:hypothetical protein [Gammaproteobacteria bacterium]